VTKYIEMVMTSKLGLLGPYSQHLIFFASYTWANNLVLHYTGLERLARDKHSSFLSPFVSYEENIL
jgi:hypothetical protein